MSGSYMIGVDIGTTGTKAVLFDKGGNIAAHAYEEYPLFTPTAAVAEQDPDQLFRAVVNTLKQVMASSGIRPEQVMFVSFSSAMHSLIAVDAEGKPLTRCITWADNRSSHWADRLKGQLGGHGIYLRTGTPIHPMTPLSKLLWLRHEQPELFRRAAKFISIKEYVFAQLFGEYVIDHSIASATGLFNLEKRDWDEEALEVAGISRQQLSDLVPTTHVMKGLLPTYTSLTGLAASTPFVVGASDGVLSNLGVNAIGPGVVAATIGTSGAVRTVVDRPITDPKGRYFCYVLTDRQWVIGGPVNNGGILFRWVRDEWASSDRDTARQLGVDAYDLLARMAEKVRPGADGLLFHPFMTGERAPLWNANARGSFFGLTMHHGKPHMIRAVLEGVIFNLFTVLLAMAEETGRPREIRATGGFARSALWRQMMADIFDQRVVFPQSVESSCLGAVVLGLYAVGEIDSLEAVSAMVGSAHVHEPNAENAALYHELLPIFISIPRKLENEYDAIAKFQEKFL